MRRAAVVSNDPRGQSAAEELLREGQSALAAALSGFLAVAGEVEGTLLAPLVVLVGGVGRGVRLFDGRLRQPGLGVRRPRGFLADVSIPQAARMPVPTSLSALSVALAFERSISLSRLVKPAVRRAKAAGFTARARVLERFGEVGPAVLSEPMVAHALQRVVGPSEGGLLTEVDLRQSPVIDVTPQALALDGGTWFYSFPAPVGLEREGAFRRAASVLGPPCVVLAADPNGAFAAVVYFAPAEVLSFEALELGVPPLAVPVERGVPRVPAGAVLPAPSPVALFASAEKRIVRCVGDWPPGDAEQGPPAFSRARLSLRRDPATLVVG
jgi:hypothetical protein